MIDNISAKSCSDSEESISTRLIESSSANRPAFEVVIETDKQPFYLSTSYVSRENTSIQSSSSHQKTSSERKRVYSYERNIIDYLAVIDKEKRDRLILEYANEIRARILQDEFIDGEVSNSERYIIDLSNSVHFDYVTDAIMRVYSNSLDDVHILEGILSMISCVPYDLVSPKGQIMAMGLLTHKVLLIRDRAIQCFEKWNSKKGLMYLKNIQCSPKWLQTYAEKVIFYIERDGTD